MNLLSYFVKYFNLLPMQVIMLYHFKEQQFHVKIFKVNQIHTL